MTDDRNNLRITVLGKWISNLGSTIFDYMNCVMLVSLDKKTSMLVAVYKAVENVIKLLMTVVSGTFADNISEKKRALIVTDFISGVICILLSFLINNKKVANIIIGANGLLAIVEVINSPLYKTIVKEAIKKENLIKYNSLATIGTEMVTVIAPLIGIWLMDNIGIRIGMLANGITFIMSAILEMNIHILDNMSIQKINDGIIIGIKKGLLYIKDNNELVRLIIVVGFLNFFLAGFEVLIPYIDEVLLVHYENMYAKILIAQALSAMFASLVSIKISNYFRGNIKRIQFVIIMIGITILLIALSNCIRIPLIIIILFSMVAFFSTTYNIQYMSYIQENVDIQYVGRVFSVLKTFALLLVPIGTILFSYFLKLDLEEVCFVSGGGIIIISLISIFIL